MNNRIFTKIITPALLSFGVITANAQTGNGLPEFEKDGSHFSATDDDQYHIDGDNFATSFVSGQTYNSWLLFGRTSGSGRVSWTGNGWDHTAKKIGFISTEDLYNDWYVGANKRVGSKQLQAMHFGFIYNSDADLSSTRSRTNLMTLLPSGYLGIMTVSPAARLDILGGADNNGANDPKAMAFQYRNGGFRHWVSTRHMSAENNIQNAIDFYLNNSTTSAGSSAPGTGSSHGMSITALGVGIGTTAPGSKLHLVTTGTRTAAGSGISMPGQHTPYLKSTLRVSNTGNSTSTEYSAGFGVNVYGQDGSTGTFKYPFLNIETYNSMPIIMEVNDKATMQIFQNEVVIGSDLAFPSSDAVTPWSGMNAALKVRGRIAASGITCKDLSQWADYVFDDAYTLKPLEEVEAFVAENKHLPDVPSEKEVIEKGIDVSQMLKIQMQKIEELTLYNIEQQKQLKAQQQQIELLKAKIEQIK